MQRIITAVVFVTSLVFLLGCNLDSRDEPKWGQTLDLCQLASWRPETYPEIKEVCNGSVTADAVLIERLAQRFQCSQLNDFTPCSSLPSAPSENPSLDYARNLSLNHGDQLRDLLNATIQEDPGQNWRGSDRLYDGHRRDMAKRPQYVRCRLSAAAASFAGRDGFLQRAS